MTTRLLRPQVTVAIDGGDFTVNDAAVTLDAVAVPYATADVELPYLDDATLAYLNPLPGTVRVPVTLHQDDAVRVFDLGLRDRQVDHEAKTVTLSLASDEALLQDYAQLADDTAPFDLAASIRAVCDYVLGKIGAHLEAGDFDADVTPHWKATNYLRNPAVAGDLNNWAAAGGCTIAYVAAGTSGEVGVTMTAGSASVAAVDTTKYNLSCMPGETYTFSVAQRHTSASGGSAVARLRFLDANNGVITDKLGDPVSTTTTNEYISVTAEAPPSAVKVVPLWSVNGGVGRTFRLDGGMLYSGQFPIAPFTGGDAPSAGYTYEFEGASNDSASTRTPDVERAPESLVWKAAQNGWDFLMPLCASVGFVLWCDEQRHWFLQTPESRTLPELISVAAGNTRTGTDTLSRDDPETYVTGVVCRYAWTDSDGISREQIDAAGTAGKVLVVEFDNTPYPGTGVAANMLARRSGTGRAQEVTTITRLDTTPGMSASLTLPGAPETLGRVSSITFHPDGFMDVGLSGLIDVFPGDWLATDEALNWSDLDPELDWQDA